MESKNRLFVLCNDKFKNDPIYACVQGGHAVAQYMIDNKDYPDKWENNTIVYLWLKEKDFDKWDKTNWPFGYPYFRDLIASVWREPDQGNIMTSATIWENDILNHYNGQPIMRMLKKLRIVSLAEAGSAL